MSQHLSGACLKAALCSTFQTLRVLVPSMLTMVAGARTRRDFPVSWSWNMMGHVPSGLSTLIIQTQGDHTEAKIHLLRLFWVHQLPKPPNVYSFVPFPVDCPGISKKLFGTHMLLSLILDRAATSNDFIIFQLWF